MSEAAEEIPRTRRVRPLVWVALAVAVYAALTLLMFLRIRHANDGHFVFALDDPYIHLALASAIRHGSYGINPGEAASPSSSVLWPFLLAPFAERSWAPFGALALDMLAGLGAAALLGFSVSEWAIAQGDVDDRSRKLLAVVLLVFVGNLVGLTFLGMEHTLQVLLAAAVAFGIIRCLGHREVPAWTLAAAALGPSVRFEGVGLLAALALALWGQGRRRAAGVLLVAGTLPLLLFGLFLHHLGLPPLPTSVLVKGGIQAQAGGLAARLVQQGMELTRSLLQPDHTILAVLFLTLVGLAWAERDHVRKMALTGAALAAGLHLAIGRFGWMHRYEVYVVLFSTLVVLQQLSERPPMLLGWFALGLLACASPYIEAWRTTISGTRDTYLMQAQMRRFTRDFYPGNVAVNDLGMVAYGHSPHQYVLDLVGLGSVESARQAQKTPAWLAEVVAEHHVGVAMIFRSWFPELPATWSRLGAICLVNRPIVLPDSCTQFYATDPLADQSLQNSFNRFAATLPNGVVAVGPNGSELLARSGQR